MLKKIGEVNPPCIHPEHYPPSMIVLPAGRYEHSCPRCGQRTTFTVQSNYC